MSHDELYSLLFGELRARFAGPPERRIFLQLCGYLVHIWEKYGERAERELSSYILANFGDFQRRVSPRISDEMLPEVLLDDPFTLHGNLLVRAILLDCAWLPSLRSLDISLSQEDLLDLAAHTETLSKLAPENVLLSFFNTDKLATVLEHLDYLKLRSLQISDADSEEARGLLLAHLMSKRGNLRVLDLGKAPITSSQAMRILDAPLCSGLECLRVGIVEDEEEYAGGFEHTSLERLILWRSWVGMGHEPRDLLQGSYPSLERITIEGLQFGEFTDERPLFTDCPKLRKLEILESSFRGTIEPNRANPVGRLIDDGVFENLTHLTIQDSMNDPAAIRVLLESRQLENLRHLDLQFNRLHAEGARALIDHGGLERLEHLDLRYCDIPDVLQPTIKERFPRADVTF